MAGLAAAQPAEPPTIAAVEVDGLERVSEQLVHSQIEVKAGDPYNPRAIARDIRRLFNLKFFGTIKADVRDEGQDQVVLTYIVAEKRLIDEIEIIGNKKIRGRAIRSALTWREGDSFVTEAYDEERDVVLQLYQSKGFPNASVDIVVEEVGPSRVRITYTVEEGKKARIKKLRFAGNEALSRRQLKKIMKTRTAWLFMGGKYDEDKFDADLEAVLDRYGDYGRLDAAVPNTEFAYRKKGKGVDVTITIDEGPEYTVGNLDIADNVVFDDDEIYKLLKVHPGDVHNRSQVREDAEVITKAYSDSGYVEAVAIPQVTLDRETKTTNIVERVLEGRLAYLNEIKITGNTVTRDDIIRREILLEPGSRFDGSLLEASQNRLEATEYFDETRFTLEDIEDNDKSVNLLVDVEEGKTSFWNFGVGFSTQDSFNIYSELDFDNFDIGNWKTFTGGGQQLKLRFDLGQQRSQYSLSFTDPEIFGRPLVFGFDIFDQTRRYRGGTEYTESSQGARIRLAKVLSPILTARSSLHYRSIDISGYDSFGLGELINQFNVYDKYRGGKTTISTVWGINRSKVDSKRDPSTGSIHDLQLEIAGLGGDNHFAKLEHDSRWFWPFGKEKKWVLSFQTREGFAQGFGGSAVVPLADRFFAGGSGTVRGFEHRDVGPALPRYTFFGPDERIGGELRIINNLEFKYKISKTFRVYTFADAGGVWLEPADFGFDEFRYSVGVGFGVDIPKMGPIRVDYGFPLNPEGDQGSGRLHLQTGFRF